MKKALRNVALLALTASMLVMLTACGDTEEENLQSAKPKQSDMSSGQNKKPDTTVGTERLLATRTITEGDMEVKEIVGITLKDGVVDKIAMTYEFEDEETAEEYASIIGMVFDTVEQNGRQVVISMLVEDFMKEFELEKIDIKELKEKYEAEGYEVSHVNV